MGSLSALRLSSALGGASGLVPPAVEPSGRECLLSPICPLDGDQFPHGRGRTGRPALTEAGGPGVGGAALVWKCEYINLHFSQDTHLGHGCEVALVCLITPPGALIFVHVFQSRKLRQGLPAVTQLVPGGADGQRWLPGLRGPDAGPCALCHTYAGPGGKDLLWVTPKGRTGPSGLLVPGYGSWVAYPFSTSAEHLYVPGTVLGFGEQ